MCRWALGLVVMMEADVDIEDHLVFIGNRIIRVRASRMTR
jgi:hypothetical protein